jgi:hypothetical protein
MEYKCNYFLGNDPTEWYTDVPNYEAIVLKDIYPGIDLKYSGDGNGQAAYEFVVTPGADISQIKVAYEGAEETSIAADGRLIVKTKWGDMVAAIKSPTNGVLSATGSFSQLSEKTIGFEADGASRRALGMLGVTLSYSAYLRAGGEDYGFAIAVDGSGCAYVTGFTSSTDFPILNPYQATYQSGFGDAFVTKLSSSGYSLIYSTFLGGGGCDEGYDIAVDNSGNAYVTGETRSSDFPTLNPYQTNQDSTDAFVTKLSSSGASLIYSTYLGGESDDAGRGIAVDGSGNAYVTGCTGSSDFPALNPYQTDQGNWDVFVTKFSSSGNSLVYSTYLGGEEYDDGLSIAIDGSGDAYVTGYTISTNFPTLNPYQTYISGGYFGEDAFVTRLSNTGNSLVYSTYLGGGSDDDGRGIAVDGSGDAYVTGYTRSSDFPTLNPYQTYQGPTGYDDVFVTKLSNSGNVLIYSTYLGGEDQDEGRDIAIDVGGNAYVTGRTNSSNFPTLNPYQTFQGYNDVFVAKLSSSGDNLIYSTYLGGGQWDEGMGIAIDGSGNAYVAGFTGFPDFRTLNPYHTTYQGGMDYWGDVFVTKLNAFFPYLCGDASADATVDISDAVYLIAYIFSGGPAPNPLVYRVRNHVTYCAASGTLS